MTESPIKKPMRQILVMAAVGLVVSGLAAVLWLHKESSPASVTAEKILSGYRQDHGYPQLDIIYPLDETLFPPESVPPLIRWRRGSAPVDTYVVSVTFPHTDRRFDMLSRQPSWTPGMEIWAEIKRLSLERQAHITVLGVHSENPDDILRVGRVSISTSEDEVGASLMYREVNLPFSEAVKDPTMIRWRYGSIGSIERPPVVLGNLPVCGNCHSFSADGRVMGLDVDYANDKGSYAIREVSEKFTLTPEDIITWSDYKREDGQLTFGLLSQVSPSGRYIMSTVKDRSVFVAIPDLAFSQLFFPIKGILAFYDRKTREFRALEGASDPAFVQSNATWSPDGRQVAFARKEAYHLKSLHDSDSVLLSPEDCREFLEEGKTFLYDIYVVPFNEGRGGVAKPLKGASANGKSNYFAKYSPDGRWIVFCRAKSFMLLQPDSELYIVPASGGEARRLRCNTGRMNSWHSWSPNSRWLVFSSKANTDYTQLFLTHIDDEGRSTPPVELPHLTAPDRAANIPEFVDLGPSGIVEIREQFVDDYSFVRAAREFRRGDDPVNAERLLRKALEINPNSVEARAGLATVFLSQGKPAEAEAEFRKILEIDPDDADTLSELGAVLTQQHRFEEAVAAFTRALEIKPDLGEAHSNLGWTLALQRDLPAAIDCFKQAVHHDPANIAARMSLGNCLLELGRTDEALSHLQEAVRLAPDNADAFSGLGLAMAQKQDVEGAIRCYRKAVELSPGLAGAHRNLGTLLLQAGDVKEAIEHLRTSMKLAPQDPKTLAKLSWILSTTSSEPLRDARLAVDLAEKLCDLTPDQDAGALDILAAGYASAGEFEKAIDAAEHAHRLATQAEDLEFARGIAERLDLYRRGQPYRSPRF